MEQASEQRDKLNFNRRLARLFILKMETEGRLQGNAMHQCEEAAKVIFREVWE